MKFTTENVHGTRRANWLLAAAGALTLGIASLGLVGGTSIADLTDGSAATDSLGGRGNAGGGFVGGLSIDEEYVGTLPTLREQGQAPGFFLEGPRETVLDSIDSMTGAGGITIEFVPVAGQLEPAMRVLFQGDVTITLDKTVLANSQTRLGVFANSNLGATLASAMTDAAMLMIEPIPASGNLEMPFTEYEQNGLLEGGIHVVTFNRERGRDSMGISTFCGTIELTQGSATLP